jgi:biopolymer transport protein ExbD
MSKQSDTKIQLHQRPTKVDDEIDITPMIDCVFLLLFFFMVTSKIDRQSPVIMPAAENIIEVLPSKTVVVTVKAVSASEANIFLGEGDDAGKLVQGDLKDQEDSVRQYIEREKSQRPDVDSVTLKADANVPVKFIAMCSRAAVAAGGDLRLYYGIERSN